MTGPLLFLSAGDPSGDNAAGRLIAALGTRYPEVATFGLGGEKLKGLGQQQLAGGRDLAVMGFWEVAKRYQFFRRLLRRCVAEIAARRPTCVLLVDYPGFNLRLAQRVRSLGIPIVYYISPQVWAWGAKRIHQIRRLVDLMLVILPFEQDFFASRDVSVRFVGHYLLEDIPEEYISSPIPGNRRLALLPGSRPQEVQRMLPAMLKAAAILADRQRTQTVVAGLKGVYDYESAARKYGRGSVQFEYGSPRRVVYESDLVLTASGTATLEAGIIGRPMVVIYKTGFITYLIARQLVTVDMIALANFVLGEKVVPELIQTEASSAGMATALERYLIDQDYRTAVKTALDRVPHLLGGRGASQRAAEYLAAFLERGKAA